MRGIALSRGDIRKW